MPHRFLEDQLVLQRQSFGVDPRELEGPELVSFIRWNLLALENELHEALNEVNWKPWSNAPSGFKLEAAGDGGGTGRDAYVAELVDALHFLGNLFLAAGASDTEVDDLYRKKRAINAQRQVDGY